MYKQTNWLKWISLMSALILLAGCVPGKGVTEEIPTESATNTQLPSSTATFTATATETDTPTTTFTSTSTPAPTHTPKPTSTPKPTADPNVGKLRVGSAMFGDSLSFSVGGGVRPSAGKRFLMIFADYTRPTAANNIKITSNDVTLIGPGGEEYPIFAGGALEGVINQCKNCTLINSNQKTITLLLVFELEKSLDTAQFKLRLLNLPLISIKPMK
jgi:hypothetical protein